MTYREALTNAVEFLRLNAPDDGLLRQAARMLERKAEKLRARQERSLLWPHRCLCGEMREKKAALCHDCRRAVPFELWMKFMIGRRRESQSAWRQIRIIAQTRSRNGRKEAA